MLVIFTSLFCIIFLVNIFYYYLIHFYEKTTKKHKYVDKFSNLDFIIQPAPKK